jgi:hypothetical protein
VSRGSFRRSGKKTNKKTKNQRPKTLKPLPSKGTKFATKKSTFQPFYLTFGQHHTLVSEITKQSSNPEVQLQKHPRPKFLAGKEYGLLNS